MKAGTLKEILVFEAKNLQPTASGAVGKDYKEFFRCRAAKKNQSLVSGDEVAKEQFLGQMAVMVVRKYPQIDYGCRVRWAGFAWEMRLIEPKGNELTLTLKKIDV